MVSRTRDAAFFGIIGSLVRTGPGNVIVNLATAPFHLNGRCLTSRCAILMRKPSPTRLVRQNQLIPPQCFNCRSLSLDGIAVSDHAKSFSAQRLRRTIGDGPLGRGLIERCRGLTNRHGNVIFTANVRSSGTVTRAFGRTKVPTTRVSKSVPGAGQGRVCRSRTSNRVRIIIGINALARNCSYHSVRYIILEQPDVDHTLIVRVVNQNLQVDPRANGASYVIVSFKANGLGQFNHVRSRCRLDLSGPPRSGARIGLIPYPRYQTVIAIFRRAYPRYKFGLGARTPRRPGLLRPVPRR